MVILSLSTIELRMSLLRMSKEKLKLSYYRYLGMTVPRQNHIEA
jgi:hypothetical protein